MLVESRFNKALVRFDQSALQMLDNLSQKHIFFNHTTHPHLPPPNMGKPNRGQPSYTKEMWSWPSA